MLTWMQEYRASFLSPWYLLILLTLPVLWYFSYRSLAGLGNFRRIAAIVFRSIIVLMVVVALAEIQIVRKSDTLTVTYLLDQSASIPAAWRTRIIEYYNSSVEKFRGEFPRDKAGAIVFGKTAEVEIPPFDETVPMPSVLESRLDPQHTNLESALRLAQATFPHDSAKRIVIVTDGNENIGDALTQARSAAEDGVSIDVVPIRSVSAGDVAVEKVTIPTDVRKGQPFDVRVVVNNSVPSQDGDTGQVSGKIRVLRRTGRFEELLAESEVALEPGKRVFDIREEITQPEFYTYEAQFVPDDPSEDSRSQNNRASAFTHVRGSGQVLLIEDHENTGEFDFLVERLRSENIEVDVRPSGPTEPFSGLPELQSFDTVILANVPREQFSDAQLKSLVMNTKELGAGLIMAGGPNSFGAGGWANTEIEEAMPVEFQIKNATVVPVGALVMMMHASEMAQGNYWQKVVGREALKALGTQDYAGLVHWEITEKWLWGGSQGLIRVGRNKNTMLARIDRMVPGDMPAFEGAMTMANDAFLRCTDAAVKHMIIISDGDPTQPSTGIMNALVNQGVKISTVAIGSHGPAESALLQRIATRTGGKYYAVRNPRLLPKIYQREARRVARPLIHESERGFAPYITFDHEMIKGIGDSIPPITGYVLTTRKDHPTVEVALVSPEPAKDDRYNTILAGWQYGVGKSVAFTTDAGKRWATDWTAWENYNKLFSQIVRWSMRPVGDQGKFTVSTDLKDGKVRVVVTALDKEDQFLNFLDIGSNVVGPDMEPRSLQMRQVAPGRYVGEYDAHDAGSYLVNLTPGAGMAPIRTGVNVPYSPEFRDRQPNEGLMTAMANLTPAGGQPGKLIEDESGRGTLNALLAENPFRHDLPQATSSQDIWHLVVMAACCLFFADVFVRRVNVDFAWVVPLATNVVNRVRGREVEAGKTEYMDRLRSRKAEISGHLEQRRATARFEPQQESDVSLEDIQRDMTDASSPQKPAEPTKGMIAEQEQEQEQEDYTSRLLKAKKKVWEDRDKE